MDPKFGRLLPLFALVACVPPNSTQAPSTSDDSLRIEVGSSVVNGRVFPPHYARNRVFIGDATDVSASWTNELTLGDSAGEPVMRWVSRGESWPGSEDVKWELHQTYHAVTLAPLAYSLTSSNGAATIVRIDGNHVRGTRKRPNESKVEDIDFRMERLGFVAGASDLVPVAVGLRARATMIVPVWNPQTTQITEHVFTVLEQQKVEVEGKQETAWKVTEHERATRKLVATWYLTNSSPFMVYAEIPRADGKVQRMTGVDLGKRQR